jgi:hypothetical protein
MPPRSNEEVARAYMDAHMAHDYAALAELRAPEWFQEWPQSGERVRGHANDHAIMTSWPQGTPMGKFGRLVGSEDRWVVTPAWTYQRIVGSGEMWWSDGTGRYPDGSTWFVVGMFEIRDGKVRRETWYFGPPLEAPAWRAAWVERMEPGESTAGR